MLRASRQSAFTAATTAFPSASASTTAPIVTGQAAAAAAAPPRPLLPPRSATTPSAPAVAAAAAFASVAVSLRPACTRSGVRGIASRSGSSRLSQVARRADIGGGIDFAIIRFKVPGFDDLTLLPRILAAFGLIALGANRWYFPQTFNSEDLRLFTEVLSVLLASCCWALPWMGRRLDEAARRQVSTRSASSQTDGLQTLAIDGRLPQASRVDFAWLTGTLLRLTNADGLAVWRGGEVLCTRGLLRQMPGFSQGAAGVLRTLSGKWQPPDAPSNGYCATRRGLENFPPGMLPSCVLPRSTESAIIKPIPGGGLLVMWSALPRAFDRAADRQWVVQAASKLGETLGSQAGSSSALPEEACFEEEVPGFGAPSTSAASRDPFARFASQIRISPGVVGLVALGILASNRVSLMGETQALIKGIDPVQSRLDLVAGVLGVTLVLQGMLWLSETPADPELQDASLWEKVEEVRRVDEQAMGPAAAREVLWMWDTLQSCTRIVSMAVFWQDSCVMQGGLFQTEAVGGVAPYAGELCQTVMRNRKGRYFAQLKNYPSKVEFLDFLPEKTQGLVLTPLCPVPGGPAAGILVLGVDSVRGVGKIDQAWLGALAEKVAVSLAAGAAAPAEQFSSAAAPSPAAA